MASLNDRKENGAVARASAGRRVTLDDIARDAGASLATVDRVINQRPGVKDRTRDRVLLAASRLGYLPALQEEVVPEAAPLLLDFVLPDGTNRFILNLAQHIADCAAQRPEVRARLHMIEGFDPAAMAAKLHELTGQSQGVALTALDHPRLREAIRSLTAAGTPVVTLASDITQVPRIGYVGLDNRAAGHKLSFLLGAPDDPNGRAVFHTAAGIQVLQFGKHVRRAGRNQALQPQHGSFADQLSNIVGYAQAGHFRSFRSHVTGYGERAESSMEPKVMSSQISR